MGEAISLFFQSFFVLSGIGYWGEAISFLFQSFFFSALLWIGWRGGYFIFSAAKSGFIRGISGAKKDGLDDQGDMDYEVLEDHRILGI